MSDLSFAEVKHDARRIAGCCKASSTGSAARHGATDPANSAGINDHFMRRARPTISTYSLLRKTAAALELNSSESLSHGRDQADFVLLQLCCLTRGVSPIEGSSMLPSWTLSHGKGGGDPPPDQQSIATRSVDQLGINLNHVASLQLLMISTALQCRRTAHGGARLLQILVVLPVVGGLFLPVLTEIFPALDDPCACRRQAQRSPCRRLHQSSKVITPMMRASTIEPGIRGSVTPTISMSRGSPSSSQVRGMHP